MSVELVKHYIEHGFGEVLGWCSPQLLAIMGHFGELMSTAGVSGGACEIGVYQGKFIIGLSKAADCRLSLAIDIFDRQEDNADNSGGGLSDMLVGFRENVRKYAEGSIDDMSINSFELGVRHQLSIIEKYGAFQFFSIDGGHQPEHVINDYRFAESVTHYGGAIIIDDITNAGWPGVMEGVSYLFHSERPRFVPLAMGYNKLILVGVTYHKRYLEGLHLRLNAKLPDVQIWRTKFFGYDMLSFV